MGERDMRMSGGRYFVTGKRPDGEAGRDPLPAGHRDTWGLLTQGTILDGAPYPHPVFDQTIRYVHREWRGPPPGTQPCHRGPRLR